MKTQLTLTLSYQHAPAPWTGRFSETSAPRKQLLIIFLLYHLFAFHLCCQLGKSLKHKNYACLVFVYCFQVTELEQEIKEIKIENEDVKQMPWQLFCPLPWVKLFWDQTPALRCKSTWNSSTKHRWIQQKSALQTQIFSWPLHLVWQNSTCASSWGGKNAGFNYRASLPLPSPFS